nr:MAG: putative RNA-dependent RNA polymerase [Narnaviridae sp.]UJQ92949.1 MAG: putative RNA-dependent RNA polymerase [Narnaviridae sp.]
MNNFAVIRVIDDVLCRLHAVAPPHRDRYGGPKQWLYLCEPKDSLESELVRATTALSAPEFPPSEPRSEDGRYELLDGTTSLVPPPPRLASGLPLPLPKGDQVSFSVDFRLVQSFSGLRAVLLVLMDSCSLCALSPDHVGTLPYTDSLSVLREMSKWSEADFVANAKYWKDWPLARFLQNPFPPRPTSWTRGAMDPLFSGSTGAYFRRLATYPSDRPDAHNFYRAVFGLAQSKRGFAQVPVSFVKRQMVKHAAQLSSPPTSSDPDLDRATLFAETFFQGFRCPRIFEALPELEGSTRACVELSRSEGGAREHLRRLAAEHHGLPIPLNSDPSGGHFIGMREHAPGFVLEDRGLPPLSANDWRQLATRYTPDESRKSLPAGLTLKIDELIREDPSLETLPTARVAEVLEPLKVRLITAMDAVRGHVARPLQAALWRYLRSSPVFRLIGEPITESIIHDLVDAHRKSGGGEDPFVSGDYSAATDGLDIRLSKALLKVVLDHLDPEDEPFREFIASALLEQILVYPKWTGISPVAQQNGQLMGSVLSFPFLCLANLFAYIMALPDRDLILRSRKRMDRLPVLINGDDILFRASDQLYQSWERETRRVGFVQSVGKNFRHPRFFTVNSVPIEYRRAPTPHQFWSGWSWADMEESTIPFFVSQVPEITIFGFLNVGLLTGQAKLTGRESLGALPLSGWHAGSVLTALSPAQAHKWFLKYHRPEILRQTRFGSTTLNLFAHPLLGGLGFHVPPGIEPRFSPAQRRIAHALWLSALHSYEGQERDYDLSSLVFLESETVGTKLLGRRPRRVEIELYPRGTPLPEGYEPFVDESGISPLPMVTSMAQAGDDDVSKARCRLSSSRLRQLTRQYGHVLDLHPLDKMTEFPFQPVRVSRSTFDKVASTTTTVASFAERVLSPVYVPMVPFQDVSSPDPAAPVTIHATEPEDWELVDVQLLLPRPASIPPPPPLTRSVAAPTPGRLRQQASISFWNQFGQTDRSAQTPRPHDYVFSRKGGRKW